jgi:hypothetical protein
MSEISRVQSIRLFVLSASKSVRGDGSRGNEEKDTREQKNKLTSHRESFISKGKRNGEQILTKHGILTLLLSLSLIIRDITQAVLLSYCCEWMKDVG